VVDAFEAMTARRAYQPRRSPQDALTELRKDAGTQFEPRLVAALEALWERGELQVPEGPALIVRTPVAAGAPELSG
jgi:HD-GYP domain-containing protein (c-di-GMP phosphodiesterase class II)